MLALVTPALADSAAKVYFIGDSVTAGFGHCGTEGGPDSSGIDCTTNQPFANAWYFGQNSLYSCSPLDPPNDRCSNNNDKGQPWNAGAWSPGPDAPSVAYSYVIARRQAGATKAAIYNWAMTGATPAQWDPSTGGIFAPHLKQITNSYVVMTLGANPLLGDYLKIKAATYHITNGICANSTLHEVMSRFADDYYASPLNSQPGGVLNCLDTQWQKLDQTQHLVDVFKALIGQGDHVLVLGYPPICPWTFGNWQPQINAFYGPADGYACPSEKYPEWNNATHKLSQFQQALALGDDVNGRIEAAVEQVSATSPGEIAYAAPDRAAWIKHEPWSSSSWVFKNDTWIHPSVLGHKQLAATVIAAMCADFHHWCGSPPQW